MPRGGLECTSGGAQYTMLECRSRIRRRSMHVIAVNKLRKCIELRSAITRDTHSEGRTCPCCYRDFLLKMEKGRERHHDTSLALAPPTARAMYGLLSLASLRLHGVYFAMYMRNSTICSSLVSAIPFGITHLDLPPLLPFAASLSSSLGSHSSGWRLNQGQSGTHTTNASATPAAKMYIISLKSSMKYPTKKATT